MEAEAIALSLRLFGDISEPRKENKRHRLIDIISIVLLGVIGGNDDYPSIEEYARDKEDFLRTFLALPAGIPSSCTLRRVMSRLEPVELERVLRQWMAQLCRSLEGKQIALDGKTLRRSFDHAWKKVGLHVVSAWCVEDEVVLAQQAVAEKSNEIPTVPALLKTLQLKGAVVTADALNCQKKTIQTIVAGEADYVLAVKGNQSNLEQQVSALLDEALLEKFKGIGHDKESSYERGHGREEKRTVYASSELARYVRVREEWPGLKSIILVISERTIDGKTTTERRYYISSLEGNDAGRLGKIIRGHWGIENGEHWCLDMAFREDENRVHVDDGDRNLAALRRLALNLLKRDRTVKKGLKSKRLKAGRNDRYMLHVLTQGIDAK